MKCPVVGRRVRVPGFADEYVVATVDLNAGFAAIACVQDRTMVRRVPICVLQDADEFGEAFARVNQTLPEILESSRHFVRSGFADIAAASQLTEMTLAMIAQTKKKIEESDQNIARWRLLGCEDNSGA